MGVRTAFGRVAGAAFVVLALIASLCYPPIPTARALPTSPEQASTAAQGWLALSQQPLGARIGSRVSEVRAFADDLGETAYYVVYLDPQGYVIVSADDLVEPIVGFAENGVYEPSQANPMGALVIRDMQSRLDGVREVFVGPWAPQDMSRAISGGSAARAKWARLLGCVGENDLRASAGSAEWISDIRVAPLVRSRWSQDTADGKACYNYYTPPGVPGAALNYPSGCVATAMAQVILYHRFPTAGVGNRRNTIRISGASTTASLLGGDGRGGPYRYDQMVEVPDRTTTTVQRQAIGALCYDAGVATGMQYTPDGSATDLGTATSAIVSTFGYGNAVFGYNSNRNIGGGLTAMLNPNLDAGLPVILAIGSEETRHAVICDGYGYEGSTAYHHLNLGWAGTADAWYNLPTVDATSHHFTTVEQCVYNVFEFGSGEIISGRVVDALGSPVPGATVTAWSGVGSAYAATSNDRGVYALTALQPGTRYAVSASKPGLVFGSRTAITGRSVSYRSTAGNCWGVDFTEQTDTTPPACTVAAVSSRATAPPVRFGIVFSEPIRGLGVGSVEVTGGVATGLSGSGGSYSVTVDPIGEGTIYCRVPAGAVQDLAGNSNTASNTASAIYVLPAPTVTITSPTTSARFGRNCASARVGGSASGSAEIVRVVWSNDRGGTGTCAGTSAWSAGSVALALGANVITIAATDANGKVGAAAVTVDYVSSSPGAAWAGPAMVSLPVIPDFADPARAVGVQGSAWLMFDTPSGSYVSYPDRRTWFEPTASTPGRGFWASFATPPTTPCGTILAQDQPATIRLAEGWNLIGQPFVREVRWDQSAFMVREPNSAPRAMNQAYDLISNYAWGWDTSTGAYYLVCDSTDVRGISNGLAPWQAYWVKAKKDCELIIPPP